MLYALWVMKQKKSIGHRKKFTIGNDFIMRKTIGSGKIDKGNN